MSVLMTAAAKKGGLRPKSAKSKPKKKPSRDDGGAGGLFYGRGATVVPPAPPTSDDRHSVWYWELDGEPMTVIFDKTTRQVWCNGNKTEALDDFGDDDDDYQTVGRVVHFGIYAQNSDSVHQGCIRPGLINCSPPPAMVTTTTADQLFVNDCLIMEHAYRPYNYGSSSIIGQDLCCSKLPPYANDELPSYEEAILQPLTYLHLGESKKSK